MGAIVFCAVAATGRGHAALAAFPEAKPKSLAGVAARALARHRLWKMRVRAGTWCVRPDVAVAVAEPRQPCAADRLPTTLTGDAEARREMWCEHCWDHDRADVEHGGLGGTRRPRLNAGLMHEACPPPAQTAADRTVHVLLLLLERLRAQQPGGCVLWRTAANACSKYFI